MSCDYLVSALRPKLTGLLNFTKVAFDPESVKGPEIGSPDMTLLKTRLFSIEERTGDYFLSYDQDWFPAISCMRFIAPLCLVPALIKS